MKTQKIKKCMSLFLAALMCVTTLFGVGTTAYAAEENREVCLVSFPRDGTPITAANGDTAALIL